MKRYIRKVCSIAIFSLFLLPVSYLLADDGKNLFEKECASCHTIGAGESGGPDLKEVTAKRSEAWLIRVIVEPDKLTSDKDAIQEGLVKKYGYEMPNIGVSRDDAKKLIAFLKKSSGGEAKTNEPKVVGKGRAVDSSLAVIPAVAVEAVTPKPVELVVTPELIAKGRALFTGEHRFTKRGAPCSSCHAFGYSGVASGNLAIDLTLIYEKMGEQGMKGVLKALKFPTMKKIYADKPLTDDEITALIAFAKDASQKKAPVSGGSFPGSGLLVFIGAIVFLTLYKRRIG